MLEHSPTAEIFQPHSRYAAHPRTAQSKTGRGDVPATRHPTFADPYQAVIPRPGGTRQVRNLSLLFRLFAQKDSLGVNPASFPARRLDGAQITLRRTAHRGFAVLHNDPIPPCTVETVKVIRLYHSHDPTHLFRG